MAKRFYFGRCLHWSVFLFGVLFSRAHADFDDVPTTVSSGGADLSNGASAAPVVPSNSTSTPSASSNSGPASFPVVTPSSTTDSSRSNTSPASNKDSTQQPSIASPKANQNKSGKSSQTIVTKANDPSIEHNSSAPVNYAAQSLEGSLTQGRVLLKGDVQIEQADALMKADVAEIFSTQGTSQPQRAVARGRVSLKKAATATTQELRAVANELEYFIPIRKVLLKGKPKIWRGRELLQGELIEVFLNTNEIKVRGARGVMEPTVNSSGASGTTNNATPSVQTGSSKKSSQSGNR